MGGHCLKTHGSNLRKGDPDFVGCLQGYFFAVEFKRTRNTEAEPLQIHNIKKWKKTGAIAFVHHDATLAANRIATIVQRRLIKRDSA